MNAELTQYITHKVLRQVDGLEPTRTDLLDQLVTYMKDADSPQLNFICTHNSRRSHLGQIWAAIAGAYYNVDVATFSGGTEDYVTRIETVLC